MISLILSNITKERLIGLIDSCKRDINHASELKDKGVSQMPNMMIGVDEYIEMKQDALADFEQLQNTNE